MNRPKKQGLTIDCGREAPEKQWEAGDFTVHFFREEGDAPGVGRLEVRSGDLRALLLPTKGLSLGQLWTGGRPLFWLAPFDPPDPESLDLWSDEIAIGGKPAPGFTYIRTFCAGVELYGLQNWGMPRPLEGDQAEVADSGHPRMHPLHGETSNIPVPEVEIDAGAGYLSVSCTIPYYSMVGAGMPWYRRGRHLFDLERTFHFHAVQDPALEIRDVIRNRSTGGLRPDWGYHITFRPESGSRLLVPSHSAEARGGGAVPESHETWHPLAAGAEREEIGILHRELETLTGSEGRSRVILLHPDGRGCSMEIPRTPYFQTWSCRGGAGSREFTLKDGTRIMDRNWDGMGIEIGSSALDHDGNIDPSVPEEAILQPGESREINLVFRFPGKVDSI